MMGVVLNEIYHNLPNCLSELNASLKSNDSLGVVTYAARAKSALQMIRENQLALAFSSVKDSAKKSKMALAETTFSGVFNTTLERIKGMKEAV